MLELCLPILILTSDPRISAIKQPVFLTSLFCKYYPPDQWRSLMFKIQGRIQKSNANCSIWNHEKKHINSWNQSWIHIYTCIKWKTPTIPNKMRSRKQGKSAIRPQGVNIEELLIDKRCQWLISQPRNMKAVGKIQCNWVWSKTTWMSKRNMAVLQKPSGGILGSNMALNRPCIFTTQWTFDILQLFGCSTCPNNLPRAM